MANVVRLVCIALCVMDPFLILLVGLSQGLIHCNLECQPGPYAAGVPLNCGHLELGKKLPILVGLGADFLDAVAPTPHHPAKRHAAVLRTLLKVGALDPSDRRIKREGQLVVSRGIPGTDASVSASQDGPSSKPIPVSGVSHDGVNIPLQAATDEGEASVSAALANVLDEISPDIFGNHQFFEDLAFGSRLDRMDWATHGQSYERPN
jgi:hypothetical protein